VSAEPGAPPPSTPSSPSSSGSRALPPGGAAASAPATPPAPRFTEVTLAAGTALPLRLETAIGSDTSRVEDPVRAELRREIVRGDLVVLPAGTPVTGAVIDVQRAGKVKGRARLAIRFTSVTVGDERFDIRTGSIAREARSTKGKDATKVGVGAGAGALIGGILGGGKGAAIGAGVGAGAGTGVVVSTRGEEVRLAAGTPITATLAEPLTLRVLRAQ
jgi:hypothetical protein